MEYKDHRIERRDIKIIKTKTGKRRRGILAILRKDEEKEEATIDYTVGNRLSLSMAYEEAKKWIDWRKKAKEK